MKKGLNYLNRMAIVKSASLKDLAYTLMNRGSYFRLFPDYWELIPVKLENAITHKNIETRICKTDYFLLHQDNMR